jgi:hypothetical protein
VGLPYHEGNGARNGDLIASLAGLADEPQRPSSTGGRVRVDVLKDPAGSAMIILRSLESTRKESVVRLPGLKKGKAVEQFSGKVLTLSGKAGGAEARLTLDAGEVRVYRV